jgi:prenyltransferase beta subunit
MRTDCETGRSADAYHTLYCLAGLSAAQHSVNPLPSRRAQVDQAWQEALGNVFLISCFDSDAQRRGRFTP